MEIAKNAKPATQDLTVEAQEMVKVPARIVPSENMVHEIMHSRRLDIVKIAMQENIRPHKDKQIAMTVVQVTFLLLVPLHALRVLQGNMLQSAELDVTRVQVENRQRVLLMAKMRVRRAAH